MLQGGLLVTPLRFAGLQAPNVGRQQPSGDYDALGGLGAEISELVAVHPGDTLVIEIGGAGQRAGSSTGGAGGLSSGDTENGGAGGNSSSTIADGLAGGGGGGGTEVIDASTGQVLLDAGGGGGAGGAGQDQGANAGEGADAGSALVSIPYGDGAPGQGGVPGGIGRYAASGGTGGGSGISETVGSGGDGGGGGGGAGGSYTETGLPALEANNTPSDGSVTIYYDASPVVVSTSSLAAGQVGSPYSATLAGAGGIPAYQWSISSGSLPGGLALDPNTGIISGTPTSAGTASITVKLTDSSGPVAETASAQLALTIRPAAVPSVWVVNTANSQVHSFPLGSAGNAAPLNTLSGATTGLGSGGGVTLDSRGQVYVADPQSNSVTEYPNAANGEYRGHLRRTKTHRNLPVPDHGY